ncbi:MAG: hypothetical protein FWC43_02435 [Planctomycetaceae bacterium]|nr:hypothetical protein [Planctomycetaceae bacterium]
MNQSHRDLLLGYLSGALDENESRKVHRELQRNESLQLEFASLRKEMQPLAEYAQWVEHAYKPPQGLAQRTCRRIWDQIDGRPQTADSGIEGNKIRIDRESLRNSVQNSKQGEWRFSNIFSTVCIGIMLLFLMVPAFQFVRNQIVQVVRQKTMKKIASNTAAISQIHEEALLQGKGNASFITNGNGTDLGSLLASFGETNLSQKTLTFFPPERKEAGKFSISPQSSPSTLIGHFSDGFGRSQSTPQYMESFPFPQISQLFDPLVTASSQPPGKVPGLLFVKWDGASTPVFVEIDGGKPGEVLMNASNAQNLIYRDGRVFFRKPEAKETPATQLELKP